MSKTLARSKPDLLPMTYVEAKASLSKCERVDECKKWADKAKALASYGKQMKDTSLENMAQRIRDRAVRRGGELLLQVKAAQGERTDKLRGRGSPKSRKAAAEAAHLSPDQAKQMVRTAKVPTETFERMVEAQRPATVEQLAAAGTKKSEPVKPEPYRNEWLDWTAAVQHLAALPACGLDVLAARRPDVIDELKEQCAHALTNLNAWFLTLEKCNVRSDEKESRRANDGSAAVAHH